jgi:enoyl-CoA hydratase/carnithine racemase
MTVIANDPQIRLEQRSPSYWRVTFDLPPVGIFGPKNLSPLNEVISKIETDDEVKVVVFDSAVEGFFITHWDFLAKPEDDPAMPPGKTGLQPLPDMLARLSRAPVVSIASIRGRVPASAASCRWPAICVLRAGKKPSYRNGRSVLLWFRAEVPWRVSRASSVEDVR